MTSAKNRMEAFSDGVFAVAITLLVLDLRVPAPAHTHSLGHALLVDWPEYAAYVTSFLTIGIIWINHHLAIERLERTDRALLVLNLLLLMSVVILPFATQLAAAYLRHPGASLATAVYTAAFFVMSCLFLLFNYTVVWHRPHLLVAEHAPAGRAEQRRILLRSAGGVLPYLVSIGVAFVSPAAALAIDGAVALYYAIPFSGMRTSP